MIAFRYYSLQTEGGGGEGDDELVSADSCFPAPARPVADSERLRRPADLPLHVGDLHSASGWPHSKPADRKGELFTRKRCRYLKSF